MEVWQNRIFLAGTEFPFELWVSNEFTTGEGPSLSSANVIAMENEGGDITALAEMDDRLLIFKRSAIYEMIGQGPATDGSGQFNAPARLTSAVGAISQLGVIKMPQGVIFKSTRGFYLLPRGASQPMRLRGVEAYESLTLNGSAILDDLEQVRFVHAEGRTLVYHFGLLDDQGAGRWTTFTGQAAVDTIEFASQWVYLQTDGSFQAEVASQFNDNGSAIAPLVTFNWVSPATLFGSSLIYTVHLMADFVGTGTVRAQTSYNWSSTIIDNVTKAVTSASLPPLVVAPSQMRATSVQATISETSTAEVFRLTALGFEIGVRGRAHKVASGQVMT